MALDLLSNQVRVDALGAEDSARLLGNFFTNFVPLNYGRETDLGRGQLNPTHLGIPKFLRLKQKSREVVASRAHFRESPNATLKPAAADLDTF